MSWLQKLFRRRTEPDALLNEGLALAMDWGDNWLAPINARLHERHRYLTTEELAVLNATCQGAMRLGHETAYARLRGGAEPVSLESFSAAVREKYPWVSQENLSRLLNQSLYYAAKTGGHGRDA
jgi:hypothetical protein